MRRISIWEVEIKNEKKEKNFFPKIIKGSKLQCQ